MSEQESPSEEEVLSFLRENPKSTLSEISFGTYSDNVRCCECNRPTEEYKGHREATKETLRGLINKGKLSSGPGFEYRVASHV